MTMLDFERIASAPVRQEPYPFLVVEGAVPAGHARNIARDFPEIRDPGTHPIAELNGGPAFQALVEELEGNRFRELVAGKFGLDLAGKDIAMNARGMMRWSDGNIHTDTPAKLVTVLLYLNEEDPGSKGALRILRNSSDLEDYAAEIPARLGTMVIFRVTGNCWHGNTPMKGKRLSLQMNYLSGEGRRGRHEWTGRAVRKTRRLVQILRGG